MSATELVDRVHRHAHDVIDAELDRLARRVPTMGPADLDEVRTTLEALADVMLLARVRRAPPETAPILGFVLDPDRRAM